MSITSNNLKVREIINQVVNDPEYKKVSSVPLISLHQLALIIIAYGCVFGALALHIYSGLSLWIVYPIMIFGFFTAFTPLHDSTHRAVSSNNILNDILGTISGFLLFPLSNSVGYRFLHLTHHRYVGDSDLDPDEPMVAIPTKYFPLGYLSLFFIDVMWVYWLIVKGWKRTPTKTRINILFMIFGNVLFHTIWFLSPFALEYLILFFIPNRIAIAYTSFMFAHTPHPEGVKWNDFPFQTTFTLTNKKHFTWSLYGQEHHSMHHFLPHIPWYKYFKVWDLANGVFRKQNIPEKNVFSKPDLHYKDKLLSKPKNETQNKLLVQVAEIKEVAKNVKTFVFKSADKNILLPEFTAGAHLNINLPSGKVRSYSCVNPPFEKDKYQIAVKIEPNGKGGSKEMHQEISIGDTLEISKPINNFVLYENVTKYILISGGIGITPLISMAHRLTEIDKYFEFHICAKSQDEIPFQYELQNWTFAPNVEFHIDKNGKSTMELAKILANPDSKTLIYFCGPTGFNNWIKQTALACGWEKDQIKNEVFSADSNQLLPPKDFEIVLNKSNKNIVVKKDETIIDALQMNNIKTPYSCLQGTCGTCITKVVKGDIDHRDAVLSEDEKLANNLMCLCVSRAKEGAIVLDL